jgi:hypothetical protein
LYSAEYVIGTEKTTKTQKVRFGGAPVLEEEYGATVTHKEVLETFGRERGKGVFI